MVVAVTLVVVVFWIVVVVVLVVIVVCVVVVDDVFEVQDATNIATINNKLNLDHIDFSSPFSSSHFDYLYTLFCVLAIISVFMEIHISQWNMLPTMQTTMLIEKTIPV